MSPIKNKRQWVVVLTVTGVFAASAFGAAGCGSGSGTSNSPGVIAPGTTNSGASITRATENTLSEDAKILATRQSTTAFVSLTDAQAFDTDLTKIRAAYPAVTDVHARLRYEPKSLLVIVKSDAPWISKWDASASAPNTTTDTDLTTGDTTLDALLKKYDATRITDTSTFASGRYYVLRFAESLNMEAVAAEFARSSSNIVSADANILIGDGDNILYTPAASTNGAKVYAFSQGYGDCPAGCISHYTHTYTLAADGSISEAITGTPPSSGTSVSTTAK